MPKKILSILSRGRVSKPSKAHKSAPGEGSQQAASSSGQTAQNPLPANSEKSAQPASSRKTAEKASLWGCHSIVDRQAAAAVHKLLAAQKRGAKGVSIKTLTLAPHVRAKKATFKVTCETLAHLQPIRKILHKTGLQEAHRKLPDALAYVLCYEAIFGEGLKPHGPAERAVLKSRPQLLAAAEALRLEAGLDTLAELKAEAAAHVQHPRAARVNTLRLSVRTALKQLQNRKDAAWQPAFEAIVQDQLLPDVILFPAATDLHDHPLVRAGSLVLQSKASCMPAHALAPEPGWFVLDACAAPGNKTTQLAALMGGTGRILALDKDPKRLKRLKENARLCVCPSIEARCQDFLETDPSGEELAAVRGILLDPSCSGSGTAQSRMDHFLSPTEFDPEAEAKRLAALSTFQTAALRHALSFPQLQRVVYSTCSVHAEENEHVVQAVLAEARKAGFDLADPFPGWKRRGLPLFEGCDKLVRTDPAEDGTDGFFVALFSRKP